MVEEKKDTAPLLWPEPFVEDFGGDDWPNLELDDTKVEHWAFENKRILLRVVTWNLCAKAPPSVDQLTNIVLPVNRFHVYIVGTEECERSIAQSAINPSKKNWEIHLAKAIGPRYVPIRSHTLQAIHMMAFVHRGIAHHCSFVTSAAVATGAGNTLGNKGGVAIYLKVGNTRILVVNAHLAAHQNAEKQRNADYWKICRGIPLLLDRNSSKTMPKSNKVAPLLDWEKKNDSQADGDTLTSVSKTSFDGVVPSATVASSNVNNNSTVSSNETKSVETEGTNTSKPSASEEQAPSEPQTPQVQEAQSSQVLEDTKTQQELIEEIRAAPDDPVNQPLGGAEVPAVEDAGADDGEEDGDEVLDTADVAGASTNSLTTLQQSPTQSSLAISTVVEVSVLGPGEKGLEQCAEVVVFMGDLNYRIKGNRSAIDGSLAKNMHAVLLHNDQLRSNMERSLVLQHFSEPPLHFRPTYKLDVGSIDVYDSGSKRRIPAWTDRILFVARPDHLQCIAYNADTSITTSDHKPVYASFVVQINSYVTLDENDNIVNKKLTPQFTSESQVCTIM